MNEYREKLLSIAVRRPCRKPSEAPWRDDDALGKELDSYERIVKAGLEPATFVGAEKLERELGG